MRKFIASLIAFIIAVENDKGPLATLNVVHGADSYFNHVSCREDKKKVSKEAIIELKLRLIESNDESVL